MMRLLFTAASALSLLLCLAAIGLWTRSYRTTDLLNRTWPNEGLTIVSIRGQVVIRKQVVNVVLDPTDWKMSSIPTRRFNEACIRRPAVWSVAGISFERHDGSGTFAGWHDRVAVVPYWLPSLLLLLPPLNATRTALRRRYLRPRRGLCTTCGYDLRASLERCPECGTQFSSVAGRNA